MMRPELLNPLFTDTTRLKGVGPKLAQLIQKVAGPRLVDLVFTLPTGLIDRQYRPRIGEAEHDRLATMTVTIDAHQPGPKGNPTIPWRVLCSDPTGYLSLVFFRPRPDWLQRTLPVGEKRTVSGKVETYNGERQMVHPDYIVAPEEADSLPLIEPVYPLTAGLSGKVLRRAIDQALDNVPDLPEWLPTHRRTLLAWPTFNDALSSAHRPLSKQELLPASIARQRLAYDELFAQQLALSLVRARRRRQAGRALNGDGSLTDPARQALPFALTGHQEKALSDIRKDMAAPHQMVRLVQGDVGSGKTMVAFFSVLTAIEAGAQAAIMAPTEILAAQHFQELTPLCEALNIACVLITGRDKGAARQAKRDGIRKGYVPLVIGTHALFSDDVEFPNLGLIVVDEQHRFGVSQRLALQQKGERVDVLVMTATPIPRTLALTTYGDMEVSQIKEKPPGRKAVTTRVTPAQKLDEVVAGLGRALDQGQQAYWVCPLVAPSEEIDLVSAEKRYETLHNAFPGKVGLVHGQMKPEEKDAAVAAFTNGTVQLLVATTVIEVGVNVPSATIIVVEHAERFGLAQLHQLRGRVGRGSDAAHCILLYHAGDGGLGETAKARLKIMRETDDGFILAEEDLRLRGAGDALGTAQSGLPDYRIADATVHGSLLEEAAVDAAQIVEEDPSLGGPQGDAYRTLLYLFGQDKAVRRLRSG